MNILAMLTELKDEPVKFLQVHTGRFLLVHARHGAKWAITVWVVLMQELLWDVTQQLFSREQQGAELGDQMVHIWSTSVSMKVECWAHSIPICVFLS